MIWRIDWLALLLILLGSHSCVFLKVGGVEGSKLVSFTVRQSVLARAPWFPSTWPLMLS